MISQKGGWKLMMESTCTYQIAVRRENECLPTWNVASCYLLRREWKKEEGIDKKLALEARRRKDCSRRLGMINRCKSQSMNDAKGIFRIGQRGRR